MGTRYTATSISGFNASPPPDDSSTGADNQITWAKHKEKLGDPLKTAIESVDAKMVTESNTEARSITTNDSSVAGDHKKTIEIASTVSTSVVTLSLGDAASMANGYMVNVVNRSAYNQTIGRVTTSNGIAGVASNVVIPPKGAIAFAVNSDEDGYNILSRFVNATLSPVTSLTGSAVGFTDIPAWAKRITVMVNGASLSGTDEILVQLGDADGYETSGYVWVISSVAGGGLAESTGFRINRGGTSGDLNSSIINIALANQATNLWLVNSIATNTTDTENYFGAGSKALSAPLNSLRIRPSGTDTFDAGSISIMYE